MALLAFDMDGTILDSMPKLRVAAAMLLRKHYHITFGAALAQYDRTTGRPFVDQLEIISPGNPQNKTVAELYENEHVAECPNFVLAPGVQRVLDRADREGHVLVLVTSTNHGYLAHVLALRTLPFALKFGKISAQWGKTADLKSIAHVYAELTPKIMFGDTNYDAACAHEAGYEFRRVCIADVARRVDAVLDQYPTEVKA